MKRVKKPARARQQNKQKRVRAPEGVKAAGHKDIVGFGVDVAERRRAEMSLRGSEECFRQLAENIPQVFWTVDIGTGEIEYVSPAYESVWGRSCQSLYQRPEDWREAIHPEDRQRVEQAHTSALRTGTFEQEYRIVRPDGQVRWIQDRGFPIEDDHGKSYRLTGIATDITRQKLTEQELQENQRRLLEAQRIGHMGSWERNLVTNEIIWSNQTYQVLEMDPRHGTPSYEIYLNMIHGDDRDRVKQAFEESVVRKTPYELRYRLQMSDGRIKWVQVYSTTEYSADGAPVRSTGTVQDITEQKLTEQELQENQRRLLEAQRIGHMGSWERNLVTGGLVWSDQAYKIFEMDPQSPAPSYEQFLSIVHREDRERVQQASAESVARNIPYEVTYRLTMSDGRIKWVQVYGTTEYSADGAPVRSTGTVQDITEQKLTEQELRENQRRLIEAQRIGRMGSWERDLTINEFIWSDQAYQILEGDPQRGTPRYETYLNMIHDDDRDRMKRTFQEAVARKIPYEISYRLKMSDGRIKWVQVYSTTEYSAEGAPLRTKGTIQDITEQKLAEQELRENQRRLLEAQRIGRMGSWDLDLITSRLTWSAELYRIFEMDPERFGASYEAFLDTVHPDDRDTVNKAYMESVARKEPYEITHRLRMPDGRIKWVHERGLTEYSADGALARSTGTTQDITELRLAEQSVKESELRFAGIISSAMDAIITVDANQNIFLFNSAAERIFGYTAAEIIGQPLERLIPARFHAAHQQHIETFERTSVTTRSMGALGTISGVRANGEEFPTEASISQLDIGGQKNYTVILRDITERKHAEQQIAESLREKEMVLREIHHRVKNNLQIISSLLHFHSNKVAGAQAKAVFLDGQDRLRSMILVHDKLYRSEHFAAVDFADYVKSLAQELVRSNQTQSCNIDLTVEAENISLPVEIAPPCGMILTELLTNVFKYAFPEGRRGKALIRVTNEGGCLVMTVQDNGVGFQEGSAGAPGSFGLELVHGLAEQLNGTVRIASGNGTTVTLQIPIRSPVHAN
jgi:PAS domain S-box-containing protein